MTEAYQVLARKWRPQLFSDLKGLEHIARTLKNAIRFKRVGHAFLFTGSRGVGKTSAARIFAKALNCQTGPAEEPCNSCENCITITAGSAADVIEIDGASNRGIDEIRLLRENVTYLPQNSPFKIYIIDEVHMLTTEAFNALLKTLEEPPAHVKFIMATTDVHKVPMTILSRCQRFDFGRLTQAVIAATLVEIGAREKLDFGSGATELLAREAQGSMRDALSLLDQARSYAGETISVADLRQALGLIESRHCYALLENVVHGELGGAVSQVNDLEQAGVDLKRFSEEFLFYLRDALFLKLSSKLKGLLGISSDEVNLLSPLVDECRLPYWQQLFDLWQQHFAQIKTSQTPRLAVEMALIELGMARDLKPVDELMGRIDQYLKAGPETSVQAEKAKNTEQIGNAAPMTTNAEFRQPTPATEPSIGLGSVGSAENRSSRTPLQKTSRPQPRVTTPTESRRVQVATPPPPQAGPSSPYPAMPPEPPPPDDFYACEPVYDSPVPAPTEVTSVPTRTAVAPQPTKIVREDVGPEKLVAEPSATRNASSHDPGYNRNQERFAAVTAQPEVVGKGTAESVNLAGWAAFVAQLAGRDARLGSMLQRSQPQLTKTGSLRLAVAPHALAVLDNENAKSDILALWAKFQGSDNISTLELKPLSATHGPQSAADNGIAPAANRTAPRRLVPGKEEIFNDPSVRFISDRFGGRVTEIKAR